MRSQVLLYCSTVPSVRTALTCNWIFSSRFQGVSRRLLMGFSCHIPQRVRPAYLPPTVDDRTVDNEITWYGACVEALRDRGMPMRATFCKSYDPISPSLSLLAKASSAVINYYSNLSDSYQKHTDCLESGADGEGGRAFKGSNNRDLGCGRKPHGSPSILRSNQTCLP